MRPPASLPPRSAGAPPAQAGPRVVQVLGGAARTPVCEPEWPCTSQSEDACRGTPAATVMTVENCLMASFSRQSTVVDRGDNCGVLGTVVPRCPRRDESDMAPTSVVISASFPDAMPRLRRIRHLHAKCRGVRISAWNLHLGSNAPEYDSIAPYGSPGRTQLTSALKRQR